MLWIVGIAAIIMFFAVILFINFNKDKTKKKSIRTVRSVPEQRENEPESRYRSVTKTIGAEDEERK